ncbi:MAG: ATP synthase subunit F [Ruminococcaceae bacterium]|nr:ATP synthase subunit F [Oscillospiraceae bacterium]
MRFFLISDNVDTQVGLRLAGIDGVVVHESQEVEEAIANALEDSSIGVILITQKLVSLCQKTVYDIKLHRHIPLIVEIPDRHGGGRSESAISEYVREAIGINIG